MGRITARTCVAALTVALALTLAGPTPAQEKGSWQDLDREAKRAKINETAQQSLDEVLAKSDKAKALYDNSYGWAAFDNLKIALGISGGGGNGVAVNLKTGERTYMRVGTAGVGLGLGGQKYQVVFLFQDEETFRSFVDKGWQANASASATGGNEGVGGQAGFVNGMAIYQLSDKGLMLNADIAGTKFWQNSKLND